MELRGLLSISVDIDALVDDIEKEGGVLHALIYDPERAGMVEDLHASVTSLRAVTDAVENGADPCVGAGEPPSAGQKLEVLARRQRLVELERGGHNPDRPRHVLRPHRLPPHLQPRAPARRRQQAREDAEQRGLAGPVRAEDRQRRAGLHLHRQVLEQATAPEAHREAVGDEAGRNVGHSLKLPSAEHGGGPAVL